MFAFSSRCKGFLFRNFAPPYCWNFCFCPDYPVPVEILRRGPDALRAYRKALEHGKTHDRRVPVMIVGQDRSGKTSLKKSLKGDKFDPDEDSTDGIEVDPTVFRATTDVWRVKQCGETLKDEQPTLSRKISNAYAREMRRNLSGEGSLFVEEESEASGVEFEGDRKAAFDAQRIRGNVSESSDASTGAELDAGVQDVRTAMLGTDSGNVPSSLGGLDAGELNSELASANGTLNDLAINLEDIDSVPEEIMHLALNQDDPDKPDDDIDFILWDFAGQSVFYTTHGLFLSRIAIYILTHNLSQELEDRAVPLVRRGMYEREITDEIEMTNLDYVHYWLSSIHSYSLHSESSIRRSQHLPANLPPVFLASTHADQCSCDPRDVAMKVFKDVRGKVYKNHVVTKVFAVDNTKSGSECEDGGIKELREAVVQAARELPDIKKLFPVKYVTLVLIITIFTQLKKCSTSIRWPLLLGWREQFTTWYFDISHEHAGKRNYRFSNIRLVNLLVLMGSESVAYQTFGLKTYWLIASPFGFEE